jgi:hypothetical protein
MYKQDATVVDAEDGAVDTQYFRAPLASVTTKSPPERLMASGTVYGA